ncbi:ABC transporter transmembrane domain-containing protein [uncultured Methylobacterium sp.]|uniref:ABC transporter transmembrane domain-containing protein n=1 Tax=uncultured Methylobacterium sp. TaxID=157278 RepID=UPI0035CB1CEB
MRDLEPRLFGYIWRHSKRDQLAICAVVVASLPFYFASLDLPKRIVNDAITGKAFKEGRDTASFLDLTIHWPHWLGGGEAVLFSGFQVERMELLFGLSGLFLALVLINGAFKFWINLSKGVLGERMLRRLRFELFSLMLRFTPETTREVKSSETATIIRDEVEPIGAFIGDAIVVPVFLGTQAATALIFILMQNLWLGLVAGSIVLVQIIVIPRLRREIIRLSRKRQIASRSFAGRVGEVLDGLEAVTLNDTGRWERAEIGGRLFGLYDLRMRIYRRKFLVKYLNNLLAQVTPFLFYAIGGVFALRGELDIGQLVAVLAAYRDLPPPLKDLIDWDQQRLDVEVKYETVAAHFAPHRLRPSEPEAAGPPTRLGGPLEAEGVILKDPRGGPPLDLGAFRVALPVRAALFASEGGLPHVLARLIAGLQAPQGGTVRIGGHDLATLPQALRARAVAYAGPEPVLFPGTIRDNLLYGLRRRPLPHGREAGSEGDRRRRAEARRTGNPPEDADDPWIDHAALGTADAAGLDARMVALLERLGMGDDLYRFGLAACSLAGHDSVVGARVIAARRHLQRHFAEAGMGDLVIPFDPRRYNHQATIAENLLFGVPTTPALEGGRLAAEPRFRAALDKLFLLDDLATMGAAIARNLIEIFRDVPPGHPLFGRFSLIAPDALPEFERRLAGIAPDGEPTMADNQAFLGLALAYIEPRQRLGLLDAPYTARLVSARYAIREALQRADGREDVEPYDPERINRHSSVLDALLFGRINTARMHGEAEIQRQVRLAVRAFDLERGIRLRGLDHGVGNRGRLLTVRQQALIDLARAILRRPEILIVDGAIPHLDGGAAALIAAAEDGAPGMSLVAVAATEAEAAAFPTRLRVSLTGAVAVEVMSGAAAEGRDTGGAAAADARREPAPRLLA